MGRNGKHLSGVALRLSLPKGNLYKLCGLRSISPLPTIPSTTACAERPLREELGNGQTQRYSLQGAYASFCLHNPHPPQAPLVPVLQKIKRNAWAVGRDTPLGNWPCDLEQVTCLAGADAEIPFHSNIQPSSRSRVLSSRWNWVPRLQGVIPYSSGCERRKGEVRSVRRFSLSGREPGRWGGSPAT